MTTEFSVASSLEGVQLDGGWRVTNKMDYKPSRTPSEFSIGYRVENAQGKLGFLKAIDYFDALSADDVSKRIEEIVQTFNAECDLLFQLKDRRLTRIIRPLARGQFRPTDSDPRDVVSYLIFEWADLGDARDYVEEIDPSDRLLMLRICHHVAVALNQLHALEISHQDLKGANLLIFKGEDGPEGKLGDLGRAHVPNRPTPHDHLPYACNSENAAPEQIYKSSIVLSDKERRRAADYYMLGSLFAYLLVSLPYSGYFTLHRPKGLAPMGLPEEFEEALPGLIDAHLKTLEKISAAIDSAYSKEMTAIIGDLCHPDPRLRGALLNTNSFSHWNLNRYITKLDLVYKRALADQQRFN